MQELHQPTVDGQVEERHAPAPDGDMLPRPCVYCGAAWNLHPATIREAWDRDGVMRFWTPGPPRWRIKNHARADLPLWQRGLYPTQKKAAEDTA